MTIAVTAEGQTLDAPIAHSFGRSEFYLIVDPDTLAVEVVPNESSTSDKKAIGCRPRLLHRYGVEVVLTGHCGPSASRSFAEAGIEVVTGCSGVARDAVERQRQGQAPEERHAQHRMGCGGKGRRHHRRQRRSEPGRNGA